MHTPSNSWMVGRRSHVRPAARRHGPSAGRPQPALACAAATPAVALTHGGLLGGRGWTAASRYRQPRAPPRIAIDPVLLQARTRQQLPAFQSLPPPRSPFVPHTCPTPSLFPCASLFPSIISSIQPSVRLQRAPSSAPPHPPHTYLFRQIRPVLGLVDMVLHLGAPPAWGRR